MTISLPAMIFFGATIFAFGFLCGGESYCAFKANMFRRFMTTIDEYSDEYRPEDKEV